VDKPEIVVASALGRRAMADLVESLGVEQLATQSLCGAWNVVTVAGHLAAAVSPSKKPFLMAILRHSGNFHKANDDNAQQWGRRPVAEIVAAIRDHADSPFEPPLTGPRAPLTDVLVHTGDIRVPLGLPHDPPAASVLTALEFVTTGRTIGFMPRGRLAGLRLVADDLGWSWGRGPTLAGRGIDVLLAATGRAAVLPRLDGEGVAVLAERLA
jgi:uncharacterized protein (TIGR03083 family)